MFRILVYSHFNMQLTVTPVQTVLNITADISRIARCSSITVGVTFPQYCTKLTFLYLRKHEAQPHLVSTLSNMLTRPTIDRAAIPDCSVGFVRQTVSNLLWGVVAVVST